MRGVPEHSKASPLVSTMKNVILVDAAIGACSRTRSSCRNGVSSRNLLANKISSPPLQQRAWAVVDPRGSTRTVLAQVFHGAISGSAGLAALAHIGPATGPLTETVLHWQNAFCRRGRKNIFRTARLSWKKKISATLPPATNRSRATQEPLANNHFRRPFAIKSPARPSMAALRRAVRADDQNFTCPAPWVANRQSVFHARNHFSRKYMKPLREDAQRVPPPLQKLTD